MKALKLVVQMEGLTADSRGRLQVAMKAALTVAHRVDELAVKKEFQSVGTKAVKRAACWDYSKVARRVET